VLFNSIEYLFFLPIVFAIYWLLRYQLKLQNLFVVLASYVFYGWWDWRFLILIAFTSFCSYASGLLIQKTQITNDQSPIAKLWLWLNIVLNLGILATFKYYDFFVIEFITTFFAESVRHSLLHSFTLKIILPVGISFYTFQALSYSIDVYRGNIKPTKDIVAFFAFISFFPQLVAGPIERATNLLPQFLQKRTFNYEQGVDGMRQILWGLFKKIVVADNCAIYVDQVWSTYDTQSGSTLLLAAILFTFQIYGDFSGYSDIAIGTAKLFGINLMRNFNNPYFSRDIAVFWRRWHISLTTWFRDYVYIPMGGNRCGLSRTIFNTLVVFLICGLWHGANWTYLVWGLYNVVLFLPLILLGKSKRYKDAPLARKQLPQMLLTFALVTIGWIIFRAPSLADAWGYVCSMINLSGTAPSLPLTQWIGIIFGLLTMIAFEWSSRNSSQAPVPHRWWIYYILVAAIWWYAPSFSTDFIYFQF
jgi:D-alanyl-lipoteichoic acid acyltransferase DltB (MBOAT superfamily)